MYEIESNSLVLRIGKSGENEFRTFTFDVSPWAAVYPEGEIQGIYRRPDGWAYSVPIRRAGNAASWTPTETDLAIPGYGELELRILCGAIIGKSARFTCIVTETIQSKGTAPAPDMTWITETVKQAAKDAAREAKAELMAAMERGEFKGKDGVSATHSWNGTTLVITSASGTSSADLKGDPGAPGAAGKDYVLTQADKAEIAASVIESLGGEPVFGYVDENNNILLQGDFADGTYNVKYDMQDGITVNIGTLVLESDNTNYWHVSSLLTKCTNSNKASTVVDGESYSAVITPNSGCTLTSVKVEMGGVDITSSAVNGSTIHIEKVTGSLRITAEAEETTGGSYTNLFVPSEAILNKRVSSSGSLSDMDGRVVTNFIDVQGKVPFTASTKIYIKGAGFTVDGNTKISSYVTTTPAHSDMYSQVNGSALTVTDEGGGVISVQGDSVASTLDDNVKTMCLTLMVSDSAITESDIQNIIITIDEPIA